MSDLTTFLIVIVLPLFVFMITVAYTIGYERGKVQNAEKVKRLGEELRKTQTSFKDPYIIWGFNIAVSLFNKYFGDKEE